MGFEKVSTHSHMSRQPDPPVFFLKKEHTDVPFCLPNRSNPLHRREKKTIDPLTPTPGRLPDATNGKWH